MNNVVMINLWLNGRSLTQNIQCVLYMVQLIRRLITHAHTLTHTLTCTLREVGNVSVVEDHLIFQHVCQSTQTRAANDAHQRAHCSLSQQPVSCSPAILIAVPDHTNIRTQLIFDLLCDQYEPQFLPPKHTSHYSVMYPRNQKGHRETWLPTHTCTENLRSCDRRIKINLLLLEKERCISDKTDVNFTYPNQKKDQSHAVILKPDLDFLSLSLFWVRNSPC